MAWLFFVRGRGSVKNIQFLGYPKIDSNSLLKNVRPVSISLVVLESAYNFCQNLGSLGNIAFDYDAEIKHDKTKRKIV